MHWPHEKSPRAIEVRFAATNSDSRSQAQQPERDAHAHERVEEIF